MDEKIEVLEKKVTLLKDFKKGAIQQIFPAQGETTPKLRFPEFTTPWEEKRLKSIIKYWNYDKAETNLYRKITLGLNLAGIKFSDESRKLADKRPFYLRKKGEILIGKQNYFNGSIAIINESFDSTICSNALMSFRVNSNNLTKFIYFSISRTDYLKKHEFLADGTGQKEISEKKFENLSISLPSLPEQRKIAEFLSSLDEKMEATEAQLNQARLFKKSLLQKMFV